MKVKASIPIEMKDAGDCVRAAKEVTEMRCGLAFAMFNLRSDRIEKAGVKSIPRSDIRAGLITAGRDARLQLYVGDPLKKALAPIAASARKIANRLDKEKKDIGLKEAPALLAEIEKVDTKLKEVWDNLEKSCQRVKK